jgi:hypothetical protein
MAHQKIFMRIAKLAGNWLQTYNKQPKVNTTGVYKKMMSHLYNLINKASLPPWRLVVVVSILLYCLRIEIVMFCINLLLQSFNQNAEHRAHGATHILYQLILILLLISRRLVALEFLISI